MRHRNTGSLRDEAPADVDRYLSGVLVIQEATAGGRHANVGVELTRHPDGAAELQLLRYVAAVGFADRRDVPIGEQTFEALADALFEPRGEGPASAGPVALEGSVLASIDAGPALAHAVREEVGDAGRVTLTVSGYGTDRTETLSEHEPAVAAYLASKAEMMRQTADTAETDTADRTGGDPVRVPRPAVSADGRLVLRVRYDAWASEVYVALDVEVVDGLTRVRVRHMPGEPAATVSSSSWEVERHWRRLLATAMVATLPGWWDHRVGTVAPAETPPRDAPSPSLAATSARSPRPLGMARFSPRPRRRYPRITLEGGAVLGVRRGKGREVTYAPKLEILVKGDGVALMVGETPVVSNHPAVVAFFGSFDEALRRDKRRQVREQTPVGWFTAPQIEAELDRIPAGWGPVVNPTQPWHGVAAAGDEGTPKAERLITVEIQLHGLGWGAGHTPGDDHPDGPTIDLDLDRDGRVAWCGYLPGRPVHGHSAEVGLAIAGAVSAIERMLAADAANATA